MICGINGLKNQVNIINKKLEKNGNHLKMTLKTN